MTYWDQAAVEDARVAVWGEQDCDWDERADTHAQIVAAFLPESHRIVDFGCGVGRIATRIAEWCDADVVGLDSSAEMLRRAIPHRFVRYVQTDGNVWPIPDGTADGAYSMLVAQHLEPDVLLANLSEMARVLTPGGRWVVQYVRGVNRAPHLRDYEPGEMSELCRVAGLKPSIHTHGTFYPQWSWIGGTR